MKKINISREILYKEYITKENISNIYAHWHLNEATGLTVLDSSGNGRNGTPPPTKGKEK